MVEAAALLLGRLLRCYLFSQQETEFLHIPPASCRFFAYFLAACLVFAYFLAACRVFANFLAACLDFQGRIIVRDILFLATSTLKTFTSTISPTLTTSRGCFTNFLLVS